MASRRCRIQGCSTQHDRNLFCCANHWRALPGYLRDDVWRTYREGGVFSEEYLQASENAEAHLEDRDARDVLGDLPGGRAGVRADPGRTWGDPV